MKAPRLSCRKKVALHDANGKLALFLVACFVWLGSGSNLYAQSSNLSFTAIPFSDPDLNRPGGGAEQWNDQNLVNIPVEGTNTRRLDKYFRFSWSMLEGAQGQYTWARFDQEINDAISKGQKFSFGIMTHYPDAVSPHRLNYDGGYAVYPQYLHNLMQAESVKDWRASNGAWVPNWNSNAYITRLLALHQAINAHLNSTSYNGVAYKDVINYIDIRGYGAFGEWHSYTIADQMSQYPAGTRATTASLNRIIDAHVDGFPNFPLVMLVSAYDANRLGNTMNPPEVAYHALTRRNNWGLIGWRRDNWGATDQYIRSYTDQNTVTVNGMRLDTAIMNRWKYAPVVGEPCCNSSYAELEAQVRRYHAVSFGNGNFSANATIRTNMRAASKAAGYRIVLEGGNVPASVGTGASFGINLLWKNVGLTQTYEDWDVVYELKNSSGTAVWSSVSSFKMKMFLPETNARSHTDNVTIPSSVAAGSYTLTVKVRDADGFRQPLPLAIQGRNTDGSYNLRSITVTSGGGTTPNRPPVANAGADKTVTLPTNSTTLSGSGSSDPDGTISSYTWAQVSGPSTSTLSSTTTANITVSNLVQGVYSYRLTVRDNSNATTSDTVRVTVNGAANQAPVANAGANQTITLPASSVQLNGSGSRDADGTISTYRWAQISGPSTSTLSSTTIANITVSNLRQGVYNYRLTVTDNGGTSASDTVTVTVNAAGNRPPVANAGADKTVTLPANSTTLSSSGSSDPDGTISSYTWAQISGPSTSTLSSTTAANITVSNLVQGVYSYRLTVRDNSNATASDTVRVTVNGAANQAPVANAGANQTIVIPASSAQLSGSGSRDADGSIASYRWAQVSGPSTSVLSSATSVNTTVSSLVEGVYTYRLTVTDNLGATAVASVTVTVRRVVNTPPVANAGADATITLPVNSVSLNGTASADANGTITGYLWKQVSGPSQATIAVTSAVTASVSNLVQGVYVFSLTVTDNDGATHTDNVTVTVNGVANQAPVANAGANQIIFKPTDLVYLNGSRSSDPDGSITRYSWVQVSGPVTVRITEANEAIARATQFVVGEYVFRLTVTDNRGATATGTLNVSIRSNNNTANQAPVSRAGSDQRLTQPQSSTRLDGGSSYDPDGRIVSYSWRQASGPVTARFNATNTAAVNIWNLTRTGEYRFILRVTDNNGATNESSVRVYVSRSSRNNRTQARSAADTSETPEAEAIPSSEEEIVSAKSPLEQESVSELKASLFPNPATDKVQVVLDDEYTGKIQVAVFNMAGERVMQPANFDKNAPRFQTVVNIQSLKAGMYNLEVVLGKDTRKVLRFVKL